MRYFKNWVFSDLHTKDKQNRDRDHTHIMSKKNLLWTKVRVRILKKRTPTNAHVRAPFDFWQNAHMRGTCVRPKIECANVRVCEAKNRHNSQFENVFDNFLYKGT